MPSGRCRPSAFGMYTRLTGRACQDASDRCARSASSALARGVSATAPSMPAVLRPALRCVTCRTLTSVFDQLRSVSFCRLRTLLKSPACAALKILRRSRRTCSSWIRQSIASQSRLSSSGPFARRAATASAATVSSSRPTCPSVPTPMADRPQRLTRPTSAPLRVRALARYPASYAGDRWRSGLAPGFLLPFGTPAFASWAVLFPPGTSTLLTVGLPDTSPHPDPDGVATFRMRKLRPGWVPPRPRDGGVPTTG